MKKWIFCIAALFLVFTANHYFGDDVSNGDEVVISQVLQENASQKTDGRSLSEDLELSKLPTDTEEEETSSPEPEISTVSAEPVAAVKSQPTATTSAKGKDSEYEPIHSEEKLKLYNSTGTAVVGDTGYEIYNYVPGAADSYAKAINNAGKILGKKYNLYTLIVPTAIGITFPDNKVSKVNSSNQEDSIRNLHKKIKAPVEKINLYDTMMQHRTEYIYYRTDHHWTGLGAYYTYREYCQQTDRIPHELEEYKEDSFGDFIGTYYGDSNKNKKLRTDEVKVYYPLNNDKLSMKYQRDSGAMTKGNVIEDASNYGISGKYLAFLGGDNAYTIITNPEIKENTACIVVKESYGNAFAPYLADHYKKVYVVDYRYWSGKLSTLAKEKNVQDILFVNNISMTRNAYLIGQLARIIG